MPASAASVVASTTSSPEELIDRLTGDGVLLLKALREVKNQIIGNKTKKLLYLQLGAIPKIVSVLASAAASVLEKESPDARQLVVQAAAALGSFTCGLEDGVRAVLDAGAVPHLTRILSSRDEKIVDAGARSLRMIFQSKLAPKYDVLQEKNIKFLLSLLNSDNENVTELAASIITYSCETSIEQKVLSDAGVLQRLIRLLERSLNQRDASLDSIAAIVKNNPEVVSKFVSIDDGKALNATIELMKDRSPQTRLLACRCLITIGHASPCYIEEVEIKTKLILILVELLEEPGRAGDEAPFALADLISGKEELQKQAISVNAVEKLSNFLLKGPIEPKRLQGLLLALAELCSMLEKSRCQLVSLKAFNLVIGALKHDSADVRIAACACLKSVSRSVEHLSAGRFDNESVVLPLLQLLHDSSTSIQVAALGVICNIVVRFSSPKSNFIECGGVKVLIQLSKSMDSEIRLNAVWALRNLMFHADEERKEIVLQEITESVLASLVCDPEASVQEQALALVRNLADGCDSSIERMLVNGVVDEVSKQMCRSSTPGVCIEGMFVFCNIASGKEFHKDAVMHYLLPPQQDECPTLMKFLRSNDSLLRTAAIWCAINLICPESPTASNRASRLFDTGVVSQIRTMVNDSCLDVKYRVRTALQHFGLLGYTAP